MKRAAPSSNSAPKPKKKKRFEVPEYHLTPSLKDENGEAVWPAPKIQITRARDIIRECAMRKEKTLIVPDKDADGLSSGAILYRTLVALGLPEEHIGIHLVQKGNTVSTEFERNLMGEKKPKYIFILDQGSRKSAPVIDIPHQALVIDHHYAEVDDFPEGADFVTACHSPPVATSSLLTYTICAELHESIPVRCDWLCVVGTHGDLGNTLKWETPFPNMTDTFKRYTKKILNDVVSLLNAPRRTPTYDVVSAWNALISATEPSGILKDQRLLAARVEVNNEVERCTHTAPKFSYDAKIAVFRISSACQIHPVIATRWAGHLQSPRLEVVLVANEGYLPDRVNFSCRIPRCARARDPPINIIETLREVASRSPTGDLMERLGEGFARGHKEASGGIVGKDEFEELMACMRVGEKPDKSGDTTRKKQSPAKQKNTLMNYFGKQGSNKDVWNRESGK
jgi:hypothetical protein